ncbi:hypothetical protein [Parvularcula marina]|uniref:hypothetical protein n=1 Tax=Parvularcula marina TaxID=2292771 RepID=UPI0011C032E0|nr:hypothetical protein [Parvularcula marina]
MTSTTPIRRAILQTLEELGMDDVVLGLLLMMRERRVAKAMERFANTHPSIQILLLACQPDPADIMKAAANTNIPD